jgi:glycosyltransferase involved in cell wall biosynthesis
MMREPAKKIRVAVIVASLDILGGQAVAAQRLLEGLAKEPTIEAHLLPINPRLPAGLRWMQRIKYLRTVVTFTYYLATLIVKVPGFDVLHVFSASNFSFLLAPAPAVLIGKLFGKPTILNYHSGEAEAHLKNWPKTAVPVLKRADRVIVPSQFLVDVFARFGIIAEPIANTVDLSRFRYHMHYPLRPVILANRNFEAHYNVACALKAFALIQRELPDTQFIVAGDGSERRALHALADDLNLKNIEFVGAVSPEQMVTLYERADVYLNASVVDNMPLSILEAFACGLAVVTTNAGGIPFLVKDDWNGLVVERGDAQGLARAAITLLNHPDIYYRLIIQALNECAQYTWKMVGAQWMTLYEELAGQKVRGTSLDEGAKPTDGERAMRYRWTRTE